MKTFLTILLLCACSFSHAQYSPKNVMERLPVQSVPFNGTKARVATPGGSSAIEVEEGVLSRKIYSNVQLTEWWDMRESIDEVYYCLQQFDNPSHQNNYLFVQLNAAGDFWTEILATIDSNGNITDWIDACVTAGTQYGVATILQFRITAEGNVIVSRLVPTSSTSIPLDNLTTFNAYRQDTTYTLDANGKFTVINVKRFASRNYLIPMLAHVSYNVWNGGEIPISEQ